MEVAAEEADMAAPAFSHHQDNPVPWEPLKAKKL